MRPRIYVDRMVDISYENTERDSNSILSRLETLRTQRNRSEENTGDIELQTGLRSSDRVNTESAY